MRIAILVLLILAVPAFAQDDEAPRREKANLPQCVYAGTCKRGEERKLSPAEKQQMHEDWERRKSAWRNRPIRIPMPKEEEQEWAAQDKKNKPSGSVLEILRIDGNPTAGVGLVLFAIFSIYTVVLLAQRRR